jgi:pyruvate dehydrogenase E2 component (dihydrolipoamide acetyltransferase)
MAQEIILPDLGMDMDEALLITWTKNPGDEISVGDVIAEVETDKTTVEVESPVAGTIIEWKFAPGENLTIGGVIGYVGAAGEAAPAAPAAESAPAPVAAAPAATNGASNGAASTTDTGRVKISPVARRIAEERGLDITRMTGSGPGGRIVREDVEAAASGAAPAPASAPAPAATPKAAPAPAAATSLPSNVGYLGGQSFGKIPTEGVTVEDVSKLRARIAERMTTAQQQIPHFYVTMDFNVDALLALRKQINAGVDDKAKKVSVNDMIVKAVGMAAREYPNVNRHYYGDKFVQHNHVNVGIAVALDGGGLINVVAHDADRTSLRVMAVENREKIGSVRAGKVKPEDISGETITVSNLGMYGVDNFIAIVNPPAAVIIAVGAAIPTPVVKDDGTVGVVTRMKMTLSGDHRAVNGAEGGEYMAILREYIENPMRLV